MLSSIVTILTTEATASSRRRLPPGDSVELWLVRHARGTHQFQGWEIIKKVARLFVGGDDDLDHHGMCQAWHTHALQEQLRDTTGKEKEVVCSPVARALQTCFLALRGADWDFSENKILLLPTFRERQMQTTASMCDKSTLNLVSMKERHDEAIRQVDTEALSAGRTVDDYIDYSEMDAWFTKNPFPARWDGWYSRGMSLTEGADHFRRVVEPGIDHLLDNFKGKIAVVFTHGGTINMIKTIFHVPTVNHPKNTETYQLTIQSRRVPYVEDAQQKWRRAYSLEQNPDAMSLFARDGHAPLVPDFSPFKTCECPKCNGEGKIPGTDQELPSGWSMYYRVTWYFIRETVYHHAASGECRPTKPMFKCPDCHGSGLNKRCRKRAHPW